MKNFNKKVIPIHQIGFHTDPEIMIPKEILVKEDATKEDITDEEASEALKNLREVLDALVNISEIKKYNFKM